MAEVIVYSTEACPYCHMLKDYLKEKGVSFKDIDVAADEAKAKEMTEKSGQMGVPVADIDGEIVVGFNKAEVNRLLKIS